MEARPRITVVNDSPEFLELIADILADERYPTMLIDGEQPYALDRIRASEAEVLMIDLRMGEDRLHGWDIARDIRQDPHYADVPILLCSADLEGLKDIDAELARTPNIATLVKPFAIGELVEAIDRLMSEQPSPR